MKRLLPLVAWAGVAFLSACDQPEDTLQTLQEEISAYATSPTDEAAAKIDANFGRLETQISQVREGGDAAEADRLVQRRDALQTQYAAARMTASLLKAKEAAAGVGEAFRKAGEVFGQAIKGGSGGDQ